MVKKGTSSTFFHSSPHHNHHHHSHHHSPSSSPSSSPPTAAPAFPLHTFSATMMEKNISDAEEIISKWDPQGSSYVEITSLFHENREEARQFLRGVDDLRRAMRFFVAGSDVSSSALLARAQHLMEAAMRRLQKEFYQILSTNRGRLDLESVSASEHSSLSLNSASSLSDLEEEGMRSATESIGGFEHVPALVTADLRAITECLISSGYGKECVKIYKLVRRSIVDEGLYRLGFEKPSPSHIQKLDWDALDIRVRTWIGASRVAVRTLFSGERALCDEVFASADSIRESCFAEICMEPAMQFFSFPEVVASKKKISTEKMFRILDMYDCISELWPEIESVFSYPSMAALRSQAASSLHKLGEAVRSMFAELESAIQKDANKAAVPGGGLHPLSRYVMNYVAFLADYSSALEDIFADYPFQMPTPLPESFDPLPWSLDGGNPLNPQAFVRIAWLILVLLCKLDSKVKLYREAALAYLFLANNLQYVISKVRGCRLLELLGDDWVARHEAKTKGYAASYERLAWSNVRESIPHDRAAIAKMDSQAAKEKMQQFNKAFEEAYRGQAGWAVADRTMREELKLSIARELVPAYRPFYERCRLLLRGETGSPVVVRFSPEDLANYLSDLFYGSAGGGSSVLSVAGSSVSGSSVASCQSV